MLRVGGNKADNLSYKVYREGVLYLSCTTLSSNFIKLITIPIYMSNIIPESAHFCLPVVLFSPLTNLYRVKTNISAQDDARSEIPWH